MSIGLLKGRPTYRHHIVDDCEFAFYVILWTALRYTKHSDSQTKSTQVSSDYLMRAFDEAHPGSSGNYTGGIGKHVFMSGGTRTKFDNWPALDSLIDELRNVFCAHYTYRLDDHDRPEWALMSPNRLVQTTRKYLNGSGPSRPLDFNVKSVEQR
jgi:hypothetical protein